MNTETSRRVPLEERIARHPVRTCALEALVMAIVIECLNQRAILQALAHIVTYPFSFGMGWLILFSTLCISLLVQKRLAVKFLICGLWLGLSIANFVMMFYRVTPLTAVDITLLPSVFSIIGMYLKVWQIVVICIAFAAALTALVILFLRCRKEPRCLKAGIPCVVCGLALWVGLTALGVYTGALPRRISNLNEAYMSYGFPYCFTTSIYDRGINRPEAYEEEILEIADELEAELPTPEPEFPELPTPQSEPPIPEPELPALELAPEPEPEPQKPMRKNLANVIFLQLESFLDPEEMTCYDYSEEVCPNFRRLKRTSASGYLTVPSIGAGTANTEFEVISGMSLAFFGTGEYPYQTVLRDNTCETIAYNLKEHDYTTTAIHNNRASFYDRNQVFSHLGFDRFISEEYMNGVRYNPLGWACDDVLAKQILETLYATEERDFIYTISVQGHGRYPEEPVPGDEGQITVTGAENEIEESKVTYYVNQIAEMDRFIGILTGALEQYSEPVILVMYGDHLPALDLTEEDMASENLFCTEYVIWNNFGLRLEDEDLAAYQLGSRVLEALGYSNGNLNRFHQTEVGSRDYLTQLELLEYDMLYGEQVVFGGENPYSPTELHMGLKDACITTVAFGEEKLFVFGEHFTPFSVVCINGRQQETIFVDEKTLCVEGVGIEQVRNVLVQQVSEDALVLSETAPYDVS